MKTLNVVALINDYLLGSTIFASTFCDLLFFNIDIK